MKRIQPFIAVFLCTIAMLHPVFAQGAAPIDLVRQAVAALGGADALRGLKGLRVSGEVSHWEPEQSFVADKEPRLLDHSAFAMTWDVGAEMARIDWDRTSIYPFPGAEKFSEIITPALGYVAMAARNRPMSGIRLATHLRELERVSPALLLKALDASRSVSAASNQKLGGKSLPAVAFTDSGVKFTILFDPKTHLPAAIRTRDDDYVLGDSTYDLILSGWKSVAGVQVAHTLVYKLNGIVIARMTYKEVAANPSIAAESFAIPEAVRKQAKSVGPATEKVAYQWVQRRLNLARFTDSDAINYDAATSPGMKLVEVAPNVQHATGGTHNSMIVAMRDYLVIFDAPINEWQSRWTIDAAKARYPGKPVKYLVLSHHHNDHSGGARTYVAEGATIVVGGSNKAHFAKVFKGKHTLNPDELQRHPKRAAFIEVADRMSIKDDAGGEIRLYAVENPHAEGMLIGHVVRENLVFVTDLWSPVRDNKKGPGNTALYDAVKKRDIKPDRYVGGHGGVAPAADLDAIAAQN